MSLILFSFKFQVSSFMFEVKSAKSMKHPTKTQNPKPETWNKKIPSRNFGTKIQFLVFAPIAKA